MKLTGYALLALVAGCATVHEERASLLAEPIDCASAEADIEALEAAKPSRRERARSAVQSVTPVGIATGILQGTYKDRAEVLTGRTEDELSARIEDIRAECDVAETTETTTES